MDNMILVPMPYNNEPDRCPKCGKEEDVKQVCKNCGYEYPEEEGAPWWQWLIFIGLILLGLTILGIIIGWLAGAFNDDYYGEKKSLVQCFGVVWQWIRSLKIW